MTTSSVKLRCGKGCDFGKMKVPRVYLTDLTVRERWEERWRMGGIERRSFVVPHVLMMILYGYTKRLDSDKTYESSESFDRDETIVHSAGVKIVSSWVFVRARRPRPFGSAKMPGSVKEISSLFS